MAVAAVAVAVVLPLQDFGFDTGAEGTGGKTKTKKTKTKKTMLGVVCGRGWVTCTLLVLVILMTLGGLVSVAVPS